LREKTVAALRERALDGCLTLDTFAFRVGAAYRAKTEEELGDLVADQPPPPALEIEVSIPRSTEAVTVGRSQDCDVVVGEETVSRFHAELRHGDGDEWTVRDLDSTNGTWLNGSRVREARVSRGDVLRLGGLRMELRL
jgi:pSer/pThr/pTyr-binding forkhead associated (FHA) protein